MGDGDTDFRQLVVRSADGVLERASVGIVASTIPSVIALRVVTIFFGASIATAEAAS